MINVFICDDDKEFISREKEIVEKSAKRYKQEVWIESYEKGKELLLFLEKHENRELCIILLDIDMPEMDGYAIAEIINKKYAEILILFVSNREELVFQAFAYKPFRFLRKNYLEIELVHALRKAFEILEIRKKKETLIECKGEKILLAHTDIVYLQMMNRKVNIFLQDGEVLLVRSTMKGMLEKLNDSKIVLINSGCAVNTDYVTRYSADIVFLKNGEGFPISRERAKSVKIQIEKNWRVR